MKRKLFVLLIIALLAMTTVFANGGKETSATVQNNDEPVKLTLLFEQQAVQVDQNSPIIKYLNEKYNIIIDSWELDPQKYKEQLNVKFAGGEMPDAVIIDSGILPSYVEGGVAAELPIETIREKAPAYAAAVDATNPRVWHALTYNGKNYGFAQPMTQYPNAVFWRKDWLDKLGLEVPTTIDEWETVLTAFVEQDPDGNGIKDTAGMAERAFSAIFGAYGVRCVSGTNSGFITEDMQLDEKGLPFFPYIDPRAKEALELLHRWYEKGIIDKEFITGENHGGYIFFSHSFMNGRIGVTLSQPSHYFINRVDHSDPRNFGRCMTEFKALNPDAEVVIGPAPIGPYGDSGTEGGADIGKTIVLTQEGAKDPRKVNAILAILNDYYEDDNFAMMLTYGIEGEDWEMSEFGPVRLTNGKEARRKGIIQFGFGNTVRFCQYARKNQDAFSRSVAPKGYPKIMLPSCPEYSNCIATLDSLTEQAYFDMITGVKPISYFDTYVQQFKAAGGEAAEQAMRKLFK